MLSMRAWVKGGATANSHSGRADENTTPWGDKSKTGKPTRDSRPSTDSIPTLNITTPMMAPEGESDSYRGAA